MERQPDAPRHRHARHQRRNRGAGPRQAAAVHRQHDQAVEREPRQDRQRYRRRAGEDCERSRIRRLARLWCLPGIARPQRRRARHRLRWLVERHARSRGHPIPPPRRVSLPPRLRARHDSGRHHARRSGAAHLRGVQALGGHRGVVRPHGEGQWLPRILQRTREGCDEGGRQHRRRPQAPRGDDFAGVAEQSHAVGHRRAHKQRHLG